MAYTFTPSVSISNGTGVSDSAGTPVTKKIGVIWAQSTTGVIGDGTTMPWNVPLDMKHFRDTTRGKTVIMGRKTWESLSPKFRPLPGRKNVVVSSNAEYSVPGAVVVTSLEQAYTEIDGDLGWVIGGGHVYSQALADADIASITQITVDTPEQYSVHAPDIAHATECGRWVLQESTPEEIDPLSSGPNGQKNLPLHFETWVHVPAENA